MVDDEFLLESQPPQKTFISHWAFRIFEEINIIMEVLEDHAPFQTGDL